MRDWLLGVYRTCNIVHRNCFLYMCISSSQTTSHRQSSFLIYIHGNKEDTSLAWRFWITFSLQKSLWLVQRTQCVFFNIEPSKSKNVVCLNTMKLCAWLLLSAYCNLLLLCCLAMLPLLLQYHANMIVIVISCSPHFSVWYAGTSNRLWLTEVRN